MKEYTVKINGLDHTLMLDEDDAKKYRKVGRLVEAKETASESLGDPGGGENPRKGSEGAGDTTEGPGDTKKAARPTRKSTRAANKAG